MGTLWCTALLILAFLWVAHHKKRFYWAEHEVGNFASLLWIFNCYFSVFFRNNLVSIFSWFPLFFCNPKCCGQSFQFSFIFCIFYLSLSRTSIKWYNVPTVFPSNFRAWKTVEVEASHFSIRSICKTPKYIKKIFFGLQLQKPTFTGDLFA